MLTPSLRKYGYMQRGFSMLEVLVSLLILMLGLLSIAGLLIHVQKAEMDSYQRRQALILLQDMASRLNANRYVAPCYAITTGNGSPYLGADATAAPLCSAGTLEQQARAVDDLTAWNEALQGAAESSGTNQVGAMIGARGCVSYDSGDDLYRISVVWQGTSKTFAPPDGVDCAQGLYGAETLRRVVSTTVKIADLKS